VAGTDLVGHVSREVFVSFHRLFVVCRSEAALSYARMQMESGGPGAWPADDLLREIIVRLLLFAEAGSADHCHQCRMGTPESQCPIRAGITARVPGTSPLNPQSLRLFCL